MATLYVGSDVSEMSFNITSYCREEDNQLSVLRQTVT